MKKGVVIPTEWYLCKTVTAALSSSLKSRCELSFINADQLSFKNKIEANAISALTFKQVHVNSNFSNDQPKKKSNWIKQTIDQVNPDFIIMFTSANFTFRYVRNQYPEMPIVVVQVSYFGKNKQLPFLQKTKKRWDNWSKKLPVHRINFEYVQDKANTTYLLWSDHFSKPTKDADIRIVGNFNLDEAFDLKKESQSTETGALYLTQPIKQHFGEAVFKYCLKPLEDVLSQDDKLKLSIRVHPRDDKGYYKHLIELYPQRVSFAENTEDMNLQILRSSHVFTNYSAAQDVAVVFDKKVYLLDPKHEFGPHKPFQSPFAVYVDSASDFFSDDRSEEQQDEQKQAHLNLITGYLDSKSLQRITTTVEKQLLKAETA